MRCRSKQDSMKPTNSHSLFATTARPSDNVTSNKWLQKTIRQHLSIVLLFLLSMGVGVVTTRAQVQSRAYVTNGADNTVSVIDTGANSVVATTPVGAGPTGVAVTPDGTRVYVTN